MSNTNKITFDINEIEDIINNLQVAYDGLEKLISDRNLEENSRKYLDLKVLSVLQSAEVNLLKAKNNLLPHLNKP